MVHAWVRAHVPAPAVPVYFTLGRFDNLAVATRVSQNPTPCAWRIVDLESGGVPHPRPWYWDWRRAGAKRGGRNIMDEYHLLREVLRHEKLLALEVERCELCGLKPQVSLQLHELVNRGRTVNNAEMRRLSYMPELTILLCEVCHAQAHNPETRDQLFLMNYGRYGFGPVYAAFEALREASARAGRTLDIELPPLPPLDSLAWRRDSRSS